MNFQENQLIDQQYVLVKYLGAGSFAEVWSAYRKGEKPAACYALKLFMSKARIDDNIKRDFEEEYAKATSFKSDYILSPIAHGIHGGITPYFVMPLCRGSLMDEFKNRKANNTGYERNTRGLFHANELISLFNNIAAALDATYKKEVIHLDIKPQNILIYEDKIEDESIGHIKYMLTDFGISKHIGDTIRMTQNITKQDSASIGMSPAYAAPERFEGQASYKSDIFSLGVTIFEMSEGHLPLQDGVKPFGEILLNRPNTARPLMTTDYPQGLKSLVYRSLSLAENDRPTPSLIIKETEQLLKGEKDRDWVIVELLSKYLKETIIGLIAIGILIGIGYYFIVENPLEKANRLQREGKFIAASESLKDIDSLAYREENLRRIGNGFKINPYIGQLTIIERDGYKALINWELEEKGRGCIYSQLSPTENKRYFIYSARQNRECGLFDAYGNEYQARSQVKNIQKVEMNKLKITLHNSRTPIVLDCEDFITNYCN